MKILVAEDDAMVSYLLKATLSKWGYEVVAVHDGEAALRALQGPNAPGIALLDWMMPGLDGTEVCRRIRCDKARAATYLILLTSRESKADIIVGLQSGANDYIIKPFDHGELQARVGVGRTVVELQQALVARVRELEDATAHVKQLRGLLPVCMYCKKVRDDQNYWEKVEAYISKHLDTTISHGICPDCWASEIVPQMSRFGINTDSLKELE
ncbi:response regulator transcription factor [Fimbriiglobus ruber]|uniref:Phosphate regulon transcriptional regulatory protein PhoB (SphR) n=1 Tax=Fimbriiglobus ruber TaxID=1908690 RepID=A0A225E6V4_9BACT|nr:response regulator transcription factor [Fimbriiglobus ruber]OWK44395.1 Phosphate regulon transcriptional regulatory protein PhoB (SphR) [Fimbriiglobus ruber]